MKRHYISSIFTHMFVNSKLAKLLKLHQTAFGWFGKFECGITGNTYIMTIKLLDSAQPKQETPIFDNRILN